MKIRTSVSLSAVMLVGVLGAPGLACSAQAVAAESVKDRSQHGDPAQYEARDLPVSMQDLQTLDAAAALLQETSTWNRQDDRECGDDEAAGKRSLFCALQAASVQVLGKYDHRRVALQEVRFAIEQVTAGREFEHRLMDFNNLPETNLADLQQVLAIAREKVQARLQTAAP